MGKYLGGILWMSSTKMNNECFHLILGYTTFWKNNVGNKLNSIFEILARELRATLLSVEQGRGITCDIAEC